MKTVNPNQLMKVLVVFFSLLVISCSSKQKKEGTPIQKEEPASEIIRYETKASTPPVTEKSFEEVQDSLREVLLNAKPNENLKSSILQELYIRGLVVEKNDEILFNLPFDLHGAGCGAPDCYSTDISFSIPSNEPVEFPDRIAFKLFEHGCVEEEETKNSVFELKEESQNYVNYFSKEEKSNLIIMRNGDLYYYPHLKSNSIRIKTIDEMFENGEFDDAEIVPYRSKVMTSNEYEYFMKN